MSDLINEYIRGLNRCLDEIASQDVDGIVDMILETCKNGKRIFVMGNGGSATTAQHFVQGLRWAGVESYSLVDNVAVVTSLANDIDYSSIFQRQLGWVNEGDVVISISASGNSSNILKAVEFAQKNGALTVGFIGFGGGRLKELVHKSVVLSSKDYGQVEDAHLCVSHIVSHLVKERGVNV